MTTLDDGLRYWRMPRQRRWLWTNVPIPEAHVGLIGSALVMGLLWPRRIVPERSLRGLGWPLVLAGAALAAWATRSAGTVDMAHPGRFVTEGPYRLSRHPMYLSWTILTRSLHHFGRWEVDVDITKDTRVSDILREYGDIAEVMEVFGIKRVAGYNFRKFISKALTVERAAKVHRVPLDDFLATLRTAVGQMPSY